MTNIRNHYQNDKSQSILPFVIAPLPKEQDSFIIAPQSLTRDEPHFIDSVFEGSHNTLLKTLCLRVFEYKNKVVITLIIPTDVPEEGSERLGLNLTLGALIDQLVFTQYVEPSANFFQYFISIINDKFDVDILQNGAKVIIERIKNNDIELKSIFSKISNSLSYYPLRKSQPIDKIFSFLRRLNPLKKKILSPLYILYEENKADSYIQVFLSMVDKFLCDRLQLPLTINISSGRKHSTSNIPEDPISVFLYPICEIPNYMKNVKLVKSRNCNVIIISRQA